MNRPRPVLVYSAVMAAAGVLAASADFADLIPATALKWFLIVYAMVSVGGGMYVQGTVTPLSAPQDEDGRRLVPAGSQPTRARTGASIQMQSRPDPEPRPATRWDDPS